MEQDEHGGHTLSFFREPVTVPLAIAFQQAVAFHFALVMTELGEGVGLCGEVKRGPDGGVDTTIAAVALANDLMLVTGNSNIFTELRRRSTRKSMPLDAFSLPPRYNASFPMRIHVETTPLEGVLVISHPDIFEDERGFFLEVFRADEYERIGLPTHFLQENHSRSKRGVVRGLHFQWDKPMAKLMRVTCGSCFLVAVDIRKGSPTLGRWFGTEVSAENKKQLWAPPGFARGFFVLSEFAELQYKCTALYNPAGEGTIRWNDPAIGIEWPGFNPVLSQKDTHAGTLADWLNSAPSEIFRFSPAV